MQQGVKAIAFSVCLSVGISVRGQKILMQLKYAAIRSEKGTITTFGYAIKRGPNRTNGPIVKVYSRSPVRVLVHFL